MTVNNILKRSLSLSMTSINESEEYEEFAVDIFNILLGEAFEHNNQLREFKNKDKLDKVPYVGNLDDENPYEEEYETAFVYGMAGKLLIADSNFKLGPVYQARYEDELRIKTPLSEEAVEEVW